MRERAGHVDVVLGTHNVHRAAELLAQHAARPITEILDAAVVDDHAMFPSALPAVRETSYNAWVTIQIGCDNHCAFCIVPAVRGVEISRPFDDIVDEVERARRRRASPRSRCSARTSTATGATSSWPPGATATRRPASGRCSPTCSVPPAPSRASAGSGSRRRTRRTCAPRRSPRWPRPSAVCAHLHYPLQSGCDRVLAAMHRGYTAERYLARLAEARRIVPDLAVSTDIIVGFPGETDDDFERTLEVAAAAALRRRLHVHLLAPPRHRGGDDGRPLRRPRRRRRALRPAAGRHRAQRARRQRGDGSGASRRCSSRGRARRTRRSLAARTPQNKLVHFTPAHPVRTGIVRRGRDHRRRAAPPHRAARRASLAEPAHRSASRRRPVTRRPVVVLGPTASGKSDVAMAAATAVAGHRDRRRRRHAGVPPDGHRHGQALDGRPAARPAPLHRPRRAERAFTVTDYRAAYDTAVAGDRRSSTARRRHRSVPGRRGRPARRPGPLARRAGPAAPNRLDRLWVELIDLDPTAAARIDPGNRRRIVAGAGGVASAAGDRSARSGRGSAAYPPTDGVMIGLRWQRAALAARIERRVHGDDGGRPARGGRPAGTARCRRPPARRSATRSSSSTSRGGPASTRPSPRSSRSDPAVRRAPGAVVPPRPAYAGSTSTTTRSPRRRRR